MQGNCLSSMLSWFMCFAVNTKISPEGTYILCPPFFCSLYWESDHCATSWLISARFWCLLLNFSNSYSYKHVCMRVYVCVCLCPRIRRLSYISMTVAAHRTALRALQCELRTLLCMYVCKSTLNMFVCIYLYVCLSTCVFLCVVALGSPHVHTHMHM